MNLAAPSRPPAFVCRSACHHAARASKPGPPGPLTRCQHQVPCGSPCCPTSPSPLVSPPLAALLLGRAGPTPRLWALEEWLARGRCSRSPGQAGGRWGQGGSGQSSPRLPLRVRLRVLSRGHGASGQRHGCFLAPVKGGRPRIPWLMGSPHTRVPQSVPERPGQSPPTPMWGEWGPVPLSEQKLESQVSTTHASHRLQMSTTGQ